MMSNTGVKATIFSSIIILTCFTMKNKRFENRSESFYQTKSDTMSESMMIEMRKWMEEERKYWGSACQEETKKAKEDIRKNKLVFFHYFGVVEQYKGNREMNELLKKYNIEVDSVLTYCTVPSNLQNCYANVMSEEIDRKFGSKFIDSLRNVAEIEYVKKNPDKIYRFEECDWVSRYPGDKSYEEFSKSYERDFWKDAEYPDDFEVRNGKELYSSISAGFILYKTGKTSDIKIDITFQNKKNYRYSSYFINELKKFIQKTKWVPAKSSGIPVNSEMRMTIHFK
ncbi:hypothetical protein OF897_14200 [Chryseobacterium formosus]|uniref:TonB C-terminal domain-containing protein n=1 Tax=Chryseobacterium formosus TaxID=1537363 RepID=A0ABT3XSG6_9FLAO|nr:hypothetical protein [Chryseobacterium formosus]MCX8525067.1 hypothetical protein [Chryseobacterium formosus]